MPIDYASLLNASQLEAVTTRCPHVRIIAGAGSGKTRVLTYRVAYLIDQMKVSPSRILAVTFTNKAANEMKERVGKLVPEAAPYLQVSTFHSFCARFLRREAHWIGYPASFTILDEEDTQKLIKDIAVDMGYRKGDEIVKMAKNYIDKKKTAGLYPDDIHFSRPAFEQEKECLKIYAEYEQRKMRMLSLDFDDLILQVIFILKNFPEAHEAWCHHYRHILVDEFQDTNNVQYELMMLLSNPETNIYVVGDPDQTIYTWRGANQGIILDFPMQFPDYQDVVLDRNYRSTKNILDAANRLIANNKKRVPKNLYTESEGGSKITGKRFETSDDEARWVVTKICELGAEKDFRNPVFSNIAVLYRSSYMTRSLESELAANRVPYRIFGGLRFYQRKEVKDVFAYFRLLMNEADDVSFDRIINVPKRGIGDSTQATVKAEAQALGMPIYTYLKEIDRHPETNISPKALSKLRLLINKMEATKAKLADNIEAYSGVLRDFITDIGYFDYIVDEQAIDEDRAGNVNAVFDDVTKYLKDNPDSTFDQYLQNIALLSAQDDMNGGNYVSLMTIHVAKGLEFDNVFIICMNEGSFPSMRAQNETGRDGLEEERRLAYVAMTRAKKKLFMTSNSGYTYVTDSRATPSQFFDEAGVDIPRDEYRSSGFGPSYGSRSGGKSWRTVYDGSKKQGSSYFSDGDHLDPFEPKSSMPAAPKDNGITDWKVGDLAHHEKFGDGIVVKIIDANIIVVKFDNVGEKTLLSKHKMLSRRRSAGGVA